MKALLTFSLVFIGVAAIAQEKKPLFQYKPFENHLGKTYIEGYLNQKQFSNAPVRAVPVTVANETRAMILPLDNMPCLVPDMKEFNMPVVKLQTTGWMPMVR